MLFVAMVYRDCRIQRHESTLNRDTHRTYSDSSSARSWMVAAMMFSTEKMVRRQKMKEANTHFLISVLSGQVYEGIIACL